MHSFIFFIYPGILHTVIYAYLNTIEVTKLTLKERAYVSIRIYSKYREIVDQDKEAHSLNANQHIT